MAGIFKAYDVRGLYPAQIDETMAERIGRAFWHVLAGDGFPGGPRVVVSRDMRSHSVPLQAALVRGLRGAGLDVIDIGLATTPMSYFAIGHLGASGGLPVCDLDPVRGGERAGRRELGSAPLASRPHRL